MPQNILEEKDGILITFSGKRFKNCKICAKRLLTVSYRKLFPLLMVQITVCPTPLVIFANFLMWRWNLPSAEILKNLLTITQNLRKKFLVSFSRARLPLLMVLTIIFLNTFAIFDKVLEKKVGILTHLAGHASKVH